MTKKELFDHMRQFDDDMVVILSDGEGWSNIETVERAGSSIAIKPEHFPVFSDN